MQLNFVMLVSGRLNESYYGLAESAQEFRDLYDRGALEKEVNSEVDSEEMWVRDFTCPKCSQRWQWIQVSGPGGRECMIQCKNCHASFAVGMNDCAKCIDRVTKCIAVIPKGL